MVTVTAMPSYLQQPPEAVALRDAFLRWQCRVRQLAMREAQGRPDDAIMPNVQLLGATEPMGQIITVMSKSAPFSVVPELQHMGRSTHDPAQRRDKALTFFSSAYYQKHREFDATLTATFQSGSSSAIRIQSASQVRLRFAAYNQCFDLLCEVRTLTNKHPLHAATWWHNFLFNPQLAPNCMILAFVPDWMESLADPAIRSSH